MYERKQEEFDYYAERPNNLEPMNRLDDWEIAEDEPNIRGWNLVDRDGNDIGRVDDLLIHTGIGEAIFAVVGYGGTLGIGGEKTLVPLDRLIAYRDDERLVYQGHMDDIRNAPKWDEDNRDFGHFYDYWSGRMMGREHHEGRERETMRGETVIPEVSERLEVGKREEQVGEVEIHKEVTTHPETVHERVHKTRVHVYRKDVEPGRGVREGEQVLREGESMTIPIVEERLVAEKRSEVTGEVVIEPEMIEEDEEITRDLRSEHVEVTAHGDAEVEEEQQRRGAHP